MYTEDEIKAAGLDVFVNFLTLCFAVLGLPEPTEIQKEIAWYLQYGPDELVIMAFRGAGKTWITAIFDLWLLFMNPQYKTIIVSASQTYGDSISTFIKRVLDEVEILAFLKPGSDQRKSAIAFDVGPASPTPTPSVSSVGIGGQLTGKRPDAIIADDVEVPKNAYTHLLREKLKELTKEFSALRRPKIESPDGKTIYLGTPQTEQTLYTTLIEERGYTAVIWPARVPADPSKYKGRLAPSIQRMIDAGVPAGTPTEPGRFSDEELLKKEAELGRSGFALQFMLDPTPSDADRYPLKTSDLIINQSAVLSDLTPISHIWSRDSTYTLNDLPSLGLHGDLYRRAAMVSTETDRFYGTCMAIDPSGKGKDETAYAIVRFSHGLLHLVAAGAYQDGTDENTLKGLAATAVMYGVTHVVPEQNYGGGMFGKLLKPHLLNAAQQITGPTGEALVAPQLVEDFRWSVGQKEVRILDVLEPVIQNHKLIVSREVIQKDLVAADKNPMKSLIYQMTRLTRDKGSLGHDDRIEALSMACEFWVDRMARDQKREIYRHNEDLKKKELEHFLSVATRGGVVYTDNRIGHEQPVKYKSILKPSGNSHFDLKRNRRG